MTRLYTVLQNESKSKRLNNIECVIDMYHADMHKSITLFGELHGLTCDNSINMDDILSGLLKTGSPIGRIDILVEVSPYTVKYDVTRLINEPTNLYRIMVLQKNQLEGGTRNTDPVVFHYSDLRDIIGINSAVYAHHIHTYIEKIQDSSIPDSDLGKLDNSIDLIVNMMRDCVLLRMFVHLYHTITDIRNVNPGNLYARLLKQQIDEIPYESVRRELNRIITTELDQIEGKLTDLLTKEQSEMDYYEYAFYPIDAILNDGLRNDLHLLLDQKRASYTTYNGRMKTLNNLKLILLYITVITAYITDYYTVARAIKSGSSDSLRNIVMYHGIAHTVHVTGMLEQLGFRVVRHKTEKCPTM